MRGVFRRKRDETTVQETIQSVYLADLEREHAVLMEAIQDIFRIVDWMIREGPATPEARAEARTLLHSDLYDRIEAATADADVETISDSVDQLIARRLLSFHRDVLYAPAVETAFRKHDVDKASQVWTEDSEQDELQGRLFCSLRELATAGAWSYAIETVAADFGDSSPFVQQLHTVQDREGLPSLIER